MIKQIIAGALTLAVSAAAPSIAAADNAGKVAVKDKVLIQKLANYEEKSVTGVIKDVNDKRIKLEGKDGKTYVVPIAVFSELKEYKELDIKTGSDISIKGDEVIVKHFKVEGKDIKEGEPLDITISKMDADGKDVKIIKIDKDKLAEINASEPVTIKLEEGDKDIKIPEGAVKVIRIKKDGAEGKEDILKYGKIEGVGIPAIKMINLDELNEEGTTIFMATEINVGGKTVSLPKPELKK